MSRGLTTQILHADRLFGAEHGATHKPLHVSAAFGYETAAELAAVFQGDRSGHVYARQGNPTSQALESKITLLEGGVGTVCFATGMGAIASLLFALLKRGDHIVASQFLFGNTSSLLQTLETLGCSVSLVDATVAENVAAALRPETRIVFAETIANPRTQIADLEVLLLEMLVGRFRPVLGVAGQMDLAVLADETPIGSDQNRGVEAMVAAVLFRTLGIAQVEADAPGARQLEQRQRLGARHLRFEVPVDLGLVPHPPARKEGRERQFGEDHEP